MAAAYLEIDCLLSFLNNLTHDVQEDVSCSQLMSYVGCGIRFFSFCLVNKTKE